MSPEDLLDYVRNLGAELSIQGGKLRVRAPAGVLTPDLKAVLATRKEDLMALLRQPTRRTNERGRHGVPDGWSAKSWIDRLRHLAGICMHADRAAELRVWAESLERRDTDVAGRARAPPTDPAAQCLLSRC